MVLCTYYLCVRPWSQPDHNCIFRHSCETGWGLRPITASNWYKVLQTLPMHFQMQCRILQSRGWNRNAIKSNIKSVGSHCNALPLPFADFILYWINCYLSDFWELHYQKYFLSVAYFNASQLTRSVSLVHAVNKIVSCRGSSPCIIYQSWLDSSLSCSEGLLSCRGRDAGLPSLSHQHTSVNFLQLLVHVYWNLLFL